MKRYSSSLLSILAAFTLVGSIEKSNAVIVGSYDLAADFTTVANPNGVWSYGYSTTLGGSFVLHTSTSPNPTYYSTIDNWHTDLGYGMPAVLRNSTAGTITNDTGTAVLTAGQLAAHPGYSGQFSVVRFTAPAAGLFNVSGSFLGADIVGTTTDVHILLNGGAIFNGAVSGFDAGSGPSFNSDWSLAMGDTLDFVVGWGNGNFDFDSTAISAVITQVPEPGTAAILILGGLAMLRRASRSRS